MAEQRYNHKQVEFLLEFFELISTLDIGNISVGFGNSKLVTSTPIQLYELLPLYTNLSRYMTSNGSYNLTTIQRMELSEMDRKILNLAIHEDMNFMYVFRNELGKYKSQIKLEKTLDISKFRKKKSK